MDKILQNFITIKEVQEQRPGLTLYEDWQIQEALNMTLDLLDSECNGLILNVIQYSLSRETKDETHPFFRTTQELNYLKRAFVAQTQFIVNLKNDQTSGNNSLTTGGLSISSSRTNNFNQVAPGVYENLAKARVYKLNDAFRDSNSSDNKKLNCLEKLFLTREEASEYVRYFQPDASVNSILVVNSSHLVRPMNSQDIEWKTTKANEILDRDNVYKNIWNISNLAFFGEHGTSAMTRQEVYNAIWNSMFFNPSVVYPNEAIVRIYDPKKNLVYTFKSNQDNNIGHNPLKDNQNEFWWKQVGVADTIDFSEIANNVLNSKEFLDKINAVNNEIKGQMEALWEQVKDNPFILEKLEQLYNQTKVENNALDEKITQNTNAIVALDKDHIAYKNQENTFDNNQTFNGNIIASNGFLNSGTQQHISTINNRGEKFAYVTYVQEQVGYRNWVHYALRHKYGSEQPRDLIRLTFKNLDEGAFVSCENNKLTFNNPTNVKNIATPIDPNDSANKKYIDDAIANLPQIPNIDLNPINEKLVQLENKDTQQDETITNLSNITAKTNLENTFTTNQTINGVLKVNTIYKQGELLQLATVKNQGAKGISFDFIQDTAGFRNYCSLYFRHKYGNQSDAQYTNLLTVTLKDTNQGVFVSCEANKISFDNPTTLVNIANPTENNHVANKQYVDQAIANIPPGNVDLSGVAKKRENNQFSQQDIKDNAPYLGFRKNDNSRKGYIGAPSSNSNDIELKAETNTLVLTANHSVRINAGNVEGASIVVNKEPTQPNSITTKKYVDDAIANIPRPNLDNVAKLDGENIYQPNSLNHFYSLSVGQEAVFGGQAKYQDVDYVPTNPNHFANKRYVDDAFNRQNRGSYTIVTGSWRLIWYKSDTATRDFYKYNLNSNNAIINKPAVFNNRRVRWQLTIRFITNSQGWRTPIGATYEGYINANETTKTYYWNTFDVWSGIDYAPGKNGQINITTEYQVQFWITEY